MFVDISYLYYVYIRYLHNSAYTWKSIGAEDIYNRLGLFQVEGSSSADDITLCDHGFH
jgi:hypothetical protein